MTDNIRHSLAKNVRALLEPNGAYGTNPSMLFHELKTLLEKQNPDMKISNYSELVDILNFHYNSRTVERLLSRLTNGIVWDCSICNIPHEKLRQLFYDQETCINIFTSATFKELLNLAYAKNNSSSDTVKQAKNAQFLVDAIMNDHENSYCKAVSLKPSNGYVDNQLLEFCINNNYGLYTQDYVLSLRAMAEDVNVTIFHTLDNVTFPEIVSNTNGKFLVLSEDLIEKDPIISIDSVLNHFQKISANKLIVTSKFLATLEEHKKSNDVNINKNVRRYIHFCVLHPELILYSKNDIIEICSEYNAITMSASLQNCFNYKCLGIEYELLFNLNTKCNSSSVQVKKTTRIPGFFPKAHSIILKNLPISEKIWIHNSSKEEVNSNKQQTSVPIKPGYCIIHGVNNLDGTCSLTVYSVETDFSGKVIYEITFPQKQYSTVNSPYRTYVQMLALST